MGVDNFFFGVQASMESIVETIRLASRYQLFLGFIFGFITASVIHALLSAEHIRHVPSMVLRDPSVSFQKVYPASKGGSFDHSYASFMKNVQQMKTIFYLGAFFIITLLIVVVTFGLK
jgi:hypothetical protein